MNIVFLLVIAVAVGVYLVKYQKPLVAKVVAKLRALVGL